MLLRIACCVYAALCSTAFAATDWRPEKPIEIIVGTPPGGPLDITARLIQSTLERRGTGVPINILNKPGGGHAIAMTYLNQRGDGHTISMALTNILTNRIIGANPIRYDDVTPLAKLSSEYIGLSVKADSPLKDAKAVIAQLRANPESLTFAITNRASGNHVAAGTLLKAAGVDLKRVKFVSFKGAAESTLAVLGGHVDIAMATPTSAWKHVQAGRLRMLAISAPRRLSSEAAGVPTWRELGVNAVTSNWRAVVGPKTMPPTHAQYWDQTLGTMVKSPEWREALRKNYWEDDYLNSAGTLKFMQEEYRQLEGLLTELGDAKRPQN